jgi:hypothetical protein
MKQQAIETMKKQVQKTIEFVNGNFPSIYSKEDVLKLIGELSASLEADFEEELTESVLPFHESSIDEIVDEIKGEIEEIDYNDYIDLSSAEFDICGNELSVNTIDFDHSSLVNEISRDIKRILITNLTTNNQ